MNCSKPELTHWQQPVNERSCGQHVFAIIVGCTPDEARAVFTHKHGTERAEVLAELALHNVKTDFWFDECKLMKSEYLPAFALCEVHYRPRGLHWVVRHKEHIYDPSMRGPVTLAYYDSYLIRANAWVGAYLTINERLD